MQTVEHSYLGKIVKRTILDNGLQVVSVDTGSKVTRVQLMVRVGWWHDGRHPGLANYMEHVANSGQGTDFRHSLLKPLLYEGAQAGSETAATWTRFNVEGPSTLARRMAVCLLGMAFKPVLLPSALESELRLVLQDIRDTEAGMAFSKTMRKAMFPHEPRLTNGKGTCESVLAIDQKNLSDFHARSYVAANSALIAAGVDCHDMLVDTAERFALPKCEPVRESTDARPVLSQIWLHESRVAERVVAYYGGLHSLDHEPHLVRALRLLDDSMLGTLQRRLHMHERLTQRMSARHHRHPQLIEIGAYTQRSYFERVKEAISQEVDRLVRGEIDERAFTMLERRARFECEVAGEVLDAEEWTHALSQAWYHDRFIDDYKLLADVTPASVSEIAGKYLGRKSQGCVYVSNS